MKAIRNPADFWSGLLFILFGALFLLLARGLDFGTALRMGPSFFPVILSGILVLVGIVTIIRSLVAPGEPLKGFAIKGMITLTIAGVLFGVFVRDAGLVIAVSALTLVSAFASVKFHWRTALIMAVALTAFCAAVFVYGLGLPIPIVGPWFIE